MRVTHMIAAFALLATPSLAFAHDVAKGPNGGQIVDDAGHHVEFTAKGDQIVLYLSDTADKPITSAKATGRVIAQAGSTPATVDLIPTAPNLMIAKLAAPLSTGAKLAVTIKLGDGHDVKARFVAR